MISAVEALALPSAQPVISPSDDEAATKYLVEIEEFARANMKRSGFVMQLEHARMNPAIAERILIELRGEGWKVEYQIKRESSKVMPGVVTVTYWLVATPGDAAYVAADKKAREEKNN